MPKLKGLVAVVTGASRGIGKAIAKLFGEEGCRLAICARNERELDATASELRGRGVDVLALSVDITDERAVDGLFSSTMRQFGRVDVLVNNAGAFDSGRIDELTLEAWSNVIGTCLTGAFLCTRAAFRIMQEQKNGRILNIGSISAQRPRENNAPYASAKFGLWGLTQATAIDGRPLGITCCCLHPGNVLIERRMRSGLVMDEEPMMSVETIAQAALAMVTVPPDVNFLEAVVLPRDQEYLGRG